MDVMTRCLLQLGLKFRAVEDQAFQFILREKNRLDGNQRVAEPEAVDEIIGVIVIGEVKVDTPT